MIFSKVFCFAAAKNSLDEVWTFAIVRGLTTEMSDRILVLPQDMMYLLQFCGRLSLLDSLLGIFLS